MENQRVSCVSVREKRPCFARCDPRAPSLMASFVNWARELNLQGEASAGLLPTVREAAAEDDVCSAAVARAAGTSTGGLKEGKVSVAYEGVRCAPPPSTVVCNIRTRLRPRLCAVG